ncbi:MAG: hypothetical protein ACK41D_05415 [Rubricoccaceae bacterium]
MKLFAFLLVCTATAPAAVAQTPITPGQTVQGTLSATDRMLDDGSYADVYTMQAEPGQAYTVTLRSADFDAFVGVSYRPEGAFQAGDDDSGGGTDASLVFAYLGGGTVYIYANSLGEGETGAYRLTVLRGGSDPQYLDWEEQFAGDDWEVEHEDAYFEDMADYAGAPLLTRGQTVNGHLGTASDLFSDGSLFDPYRIQLRRGQTVTVTMRSSDFDTFLMVGRLDGSVVTEELGSDDDSGGGTDARLSFTADRDGVYIIRANALYEGVGGTYRLTVE